MTVKFGGCSPSKFSGGGRGGWHDARMDGRLKLVALVGLALDDLAKRL